MGWHVIFKGNLEPFPLKARPTVAIELSLLL